MICLVCKEELYYDSENQIWLCHNIKCEANLDSSFNGDNI